MVSYLERYQRGEREQVWDELLALADQVRSEPLYADALAVARETMRRAQHNIEVLIPRLRDLGYEFGHDWAIRRAALSPEEVQEMDRNEPVLSPPSGDVERIIGEVERRAGTLPLSLRAFYEVVGGVNFVGSHSAWHTDSLDPLEVLSAQAVLELDEWNRWSDDRRDDGGCELPIAPDEYFKYLYSGGGPYAISLLSPVADASLLHERHHTTFVNYLRICFLWAGLPGLERALKPPTEDLAYLTEGLLPI